MKKMKVFQSAVLISSLSLVAAGCNGRGQNVQAPIVDGRVTSSDPANANLMPTQVAGVSYAAQPTSSGTSYAPRAFVQAAAPQQANPQQTNPGRTTQNEAYQYNTQAPVDQDGQPYNDNTMPPPDNDQQPYADPNQPGYSDQQAANAAEYDEYNDLLDPNVPAATEPPPPLPEDYEQPEAPADDYMWTPGYWDYAPTGYYYVPGVWVAPPFVGALWTPGWWGFYGGAYRWHRGYWGRHIGYYGGINYGFGYVGIGYQGGYWNGDHFWYNSAVNRIPPGRFTNVYNRRVTVVNNTYINNSRVSYVGGNGGLRRAPSQRELAAVREQRVPPMQSQIQHREAAMQNRSQFFQQNRGRPQQVVTQKALPAQRGITAPPRTAAPATFNNMRPGQNQPGENGRPSPQPGAQPNISPQQRQQFEQQRNQQQQQRLEQQNQQNQQRQQQDQQRQQQQNQRQQEMQNRQNLLRQQQDQQNQQRQQQMQQRSQQEQQQRMQQRQQEQQQRMQQQVQRQQQQQQMRQQQRIPQMQRSSPPPSPHQQRH